MNLTSCKHCGVVLDKDYITFPDINKSDGTTDIERAIWTGREFVAFAPCPVCESPIREDG